MIKTLKMEVAFSNMFLQRNFTDGICFKLNSMCDFLRTRMHEDEDKAEKMIAADLSDTDEFIRLAQRISDNEEGLNAAQGYLEEFSKYYREISDGAMPPSLLPKEKKVASRETREALIVRLAAKKQA